MISHKTAAFYTEQCTSPSLYHHSKVSRHGSNQSLNDYGFISNAIFKTRMHAHKSLSYKSNYNFAELEIGCVHEDRESLWHPLLTECLNRACQ